MKDQKDYRPTTLNANKQLIWKEIPGFPNYNASNTGLVKNIKRNKLLIPKVDRYGYLKLTLCNNAKLKYITVHRIIMLAFVGPSNLSVNHKDRNRQNNNLNNLEYMTIGDNIRHACQEGTNRKGENNNQAKLNLSQVKQIKKLASKGCTEKELSFKFNVSRAAISKIKLGRTWKNV